MGLKKLEERNKEILAQRKQGDTQKKIAERYNLSQTSIMVICMRAKRIQDKRVVHDEVVDQVKQALLRRLDELEWSVRTRNYLINNGIICIGDLIKQSEHDLLLIPNLGRVCLDEIKEVLGTMGLHLTKKEMTRWRHGELITYYA